MYESTLHTIALYSVVDPDPNPVNPELFGQIESGIIAPDLDLTLKKKSV
jgi:hypothetical protein